MNSVCSPSTLSTLPAPIPALTLAATLALAASTALPAHAQWTVTNLHPVGALRSLAHGGEGG